MSLRETNAATPDPSRRRADAVGWLRELFPDRPLPPQATDDDLRAALASGRLLCALLRRLCPGALLDAAATDNAGRFRAAIQRMGLPTFSAYDLERGEMSAVITCILALKDRFGSEDRSSTFLTRSDSEGSRRSMEAKIQRSLTSPIMSEPSTPSFGVDPYSPSRVFQLKQGYTDLPDCKISDLMKSTSLENAPTQSLLGVVNSILDESIERKNGQIPYRIACLLRKVIAEIERRISTQAGHIRNQNNLIKAREEKYQSRIKVLEALASGAHGQTNVEKGKLEGKGQLGEEDVVRLMKYEEDFVRLMKEKEDMIRLLKEKDDMIRLLKEKEDMVRLLKVKEDTVDLKNDNGDNTQRMLDENNERLLKEKDDTVVRLTKEKEEMGRKLKEKDDIILLMKETKDMVNLKDVKIGGTQRTLDENKDRLLKEKDDIVVQLRKEKGDMIKLLEEKENIIRLMKEKENTVNIESDKIEDRKQAVEDNRDRLIKENNDILAKLTAEKDEITKLLKEKEDIIKLMKEKEDRAEAKKDNAEDRKQSTGEDEGRSLEEKGDIIRLIKEKEDYSNTIMKLKKELESLRSSYEESCKLLESKKEDIVKVLTDKKMNDNIILQLRQDLETTKKLHEAHCEQLETTAAQANKKSEQRIKEIELMLEDSTSRKRELEELSESRIQFWKQKELVVNQFIGLQIKNVQDLRLSSVSVRHEILNCQKIWLQELSGLGENIKMVTNAAEKYHATLADNRKLFNEIQELKGNIRVYCRIRPFRPTEDEKSTSIEYIGENGELTLSNPAKKGKEGGKNFTFNKVFGPATTQDMVFKDIQPLIRSVLDGYNVCIFAYGQTGSGKTYTMMGPDNATEKEWGVNYRALNDLFSISHDRRETIKYELGVQMVEIYNEQIRDLLDSGGSQKKLGIQNTTQPNGLAVPDATMCPVTSTPHVIELMQTGHNNRSMSATAMNERSSRSHSVVTIHVQGQDLKTKNTLRGALHLVDLAGSERVDRSAVTGDRLKEAQHINKSLAALGDVIFSLSQKNSHVPYRNSKLTQVLQTSLGGHAKTLMFVQVNPDVLSYTETLSTLKFAERVSGVELGAARTNKEGKDVRELMDQISMLKDTISKKDEEIDRLQAVNTSTSRLKSTRTDSLLKHSSSSPGMTSLGKVSSFGSGAASDVDNFSDTSDRHSEAGSMLSIDDTQPPGQSSVDPEISAVGDLDLDGRLSDVSDGGGAEIESSVNSVMDQGQEKAPSSGKERLAKAVNRVQKLTPPKVGQASSLRPKPKDPSAPKSSVMPGARRSTTSQATPPARASGTSKRVP